MTESQKRIKGLEVEVRRFKRDAMVRGENRDPTVEEGHMAGVQGLKQMGLMPMHLPDNQMILPRQQLPNDAERKKLKEQLCGTGVMGDVTRSHELQSEEGKVDLVCQGCGEKSKVKSSKYVKSNISIKKQEQWPHMNVMRKYVKRGTFDQMDFETFVAGETHVIFNMQDQVEAMGRLRVLCKVAHWTCRCHDWSLIRS